MRAVVFDNWRTTPHLADLDRPEPGFGEVLLKVAGAGACHSDVALYREFTPESPGALPPPFVLGHESSGWIEALGPGVAGFDIGEAHLVYGPLGCRRCRRCASGQVNYCEDPGPAAAIGLGRNGGMAEHVAVPAQNLVPLGELDPVDAAPLSDAGLTPYHAIKAALPHLAGGGRTALVIGLGGLGRSAVQLLTALTGAAVLATDLKEAAVREAEQDGALAVAGGDGQLAAIRELTGGRGVDAVFDCVGTSATMRLAQSSVAQGGRVTVVGIGGGAVEWSMFGMPFESLLTATYWGSLAELHEVVDLYRAGQIRPHVERFAVDEALEAYRRLERGELSGRAVVVPHA